MAVKRCSACEKLIQEGLTIETDIFDYYCNDKCASEHFTPKHIIELKESGIIQHEDWHEIEMDEEDFSYLMNELLSGEISEIAKVMEILNHSNDSKLMNKFISYLQDQARVFDLLDSVENKRGNQLS